MDPEFDAMFVDMRQEEAELEYSAPLPVCTCEFDEETCQIHGTDVNED